MSEIKLKPFTLSECEEFYRSRQIMLDRYDILQGYMIFGGVPYYLDLINRSGSLAQNVDRMVFEKKGKLSDEFERLFSSMFTNADEAIKVIRALSGKRIGYTREELLKKTGIMEIKFALGISGVHTETYSWKGEDSQIDMIIDRDDRFINLCECKYTVNEFTIDKEYDSVLRTRQAHKRNEYSGRIPSVITSDDLFMKLK